MAKAAPKPTPAAIDRGDLHHLLEALKKKGFQVIGPTVRDGAIIYDKLADLKDLPVGWTDVQSGGHYALEKRKDEALFGYNVGAQSWKSYLHVPRANLWAGKRDGMKSIDVDHEAPKLAFFGVRACELKAIAIQDQVLLKGPYVDPAYAARRKAIFIVAVNCGEAGKTCFCASMQTGPQAEGDFDLSLTEVLEKGKHRFIVEAGSKRGQDLLKDLPHREATADDVAAADRAIAHATASMGKTLKTDGIKEALYAGAEHPRWDEVAKRCMSCANCTFVCPTCFCMTVEDTTDLAGATAQRARRWDSCFTLDFSYIHGGSVRSSVKARYRQWLTHKLGAWHDQFGQSGCVGCGRCITWCPVGIDITEEAAAIQNPAYVKEVRRGDD